MTQTIKAGDRITYPKSAWYGAIFPDFEGTVVEVTPSGYLKVNFDRTPGNRIDTIAPADLVLS